MGYMAGHDHIWRCSCGGGHFLTFQWVDDPPPGGGDIQVAGWWYAEGDFRTTWWDRVRMACRVLISGHTSSRVEVLVDGPKAYEISEAMRRMADLALDPRRSDEVSAER